MKIQSKVFKVAHQIKKHCKSWSEALKNAWNKVRLLKRLNNKLCFFEFKKKSTGEIRTALATRNLDFIDYEFKGGSYKKWYIVRFHDKNLNDWRCLDIRTLLKIHW